MDIGAHSSRSGSYRSTVLSYVPVFKYNWYSNMYVCGATLEVLSLTRNNNSERRNWFALAVFALIINYSAEIMQT